MSKYRNEKNYPNHEKSKEDLIKGQVNEKLYSEKPLQEGYQPKDKLDTSNPPGSDKDK
ncbi:hypothetical protein RCC89_14530 [Cytophagaceae bacterium ABcell3]|nr:hypothetical protein RCC89_14530 [Cytophagaceae bacterium ABcell3]